LNIEEQICYDPKLQNEQVEKSILQYLLKNPDAGDTLEGIVHWWLLRERIEHEVAQISAILDRFIKENILIKTEINPGNVIFRINKANIEKISHMLNI
jgi:hypothetical protein